MVRHQSCRSRGGFLIVEILLGIAIFSMFLFAAGLVLFQGQEGSIAGGDRIRGAFLAQRMLEASRSIRDGAFSNLVPGIHGIALSGGTWTYNGTSTAASGGYVGSVAVGTLASDWASLMATMSWKHGVNRSGSLMLAGELTDWRRPQSVGNWSAVTLSGSFIVNGALFNDVALTRNVAYVTSETSGGGAGLYVLNVANLSTPTLSTMVNVGGAGYQAVVRGNVLYVLTAEAAAEVKAYDISDPAALSLKVSYNLPGSGRGRTIAYSGNRFYVGGIPNPGAGERAVYQFDITSSGAIVLLDQWDDAGTISMIALTGTSAYLADGDDAGELKVLRRNTGSIVYVGAYNLSDDTVDGLSIAVSGTSALLGRQKTSFQELVVFNVRGGGVPQAPGPWYHEGSGSLVGVDADGNACFGFLAASSGRKALQVVHLFDKTNLPELATYTSVNGKGRGLRYDHRRDVVYLLTDSAVLIMEPSGAGSGPCP